MKVFLAIRGENGEGYEVLNVYDTYEKAKKRCQEEEKEPGFMSCDYTDVQEYPIE